VGGTATVTGATSLAAGSIVGGANVTTLLDVTAGTSGTIDTINVDGGSATTIRLTGGAGTDKFALTGVDDGATIDLEGGTVDTYTVTLTDGDYTIGGDASKTVTIVANGDSVAIEVTEALAGTTEGGIVFSGTADVSVTTDATTDVSAGISITKTGSGVVSIDIEAALDNEAVDLDEVEVDRLILSGAMGEATATYTINENTTLVLSENVANTAGDQLTVNVDNAEGELAAAAGTLNLIIQETQTGGITTGAKVGTLVVQADPDEAADTDDDAVITITQDILPDANTDMIVFQGAANLKIGSLAAAAVADITTSAVGMTGDLDIESYVMSGAAYLGSGDDTFLIGEIGAGAILAVRGGAGDDTINAGDNEGTYKLYGEDGNDTLGHADTDDASTIDGGAGDDTIAGGAGVDSIVGGSGNDEINGGGAADTITTGAGSDIVTIAVGDDGDGTEKVTDFTKGTDKLVLTGAAGAAVDLSDLAEPSAAGLYDIANFDFILTGVSATDLRDSIQLGAEGAAFTATAGTAVVGGDFDDVIVTAAEEGGATTITGGGGADSITLDDDDAQTLVIAAGDSTTTDYDSITDFITLSDILDLDSATIADAEVGLNGTDVGVFAKHTVAAGGAVSFLTSADAAITVSLTNFTTAVSYLSTNITNGDTVQFAYGGDVWVFQGDADGDSLIRLVGVADADGNALVAAGAEADAEIFQIILG
jgi:hypothetical protein